MPLDSAEQLLHRIERADPESAETIASHASQVNYQRLPFYQTHSLALVEVLLPNRTLRLRYADDGESVIPIMNDAGVRALNTRDAPRISSEWVAHYLRFYLEATAARRFLWAEQLSDIPWLEKARGELVLRAEVAKKLRPPRVAMAEVGFEVQVTVLELDSLIVLHARVAPNGDVTFLGRELIESGLPVPVVDSVIIESPLKELAPVKSDDAPSPSRSEIVYKS